MCRIFSYEPEISPISLESILQKIVLEHTWSRLINDTFANLKLYFALSSEPGIYFGMCRILTYGHEIFSISLESILQKNVLEHT